MRLCEDEKDDNLYDEARAAIHHKRTWKSELSIRKNENHMLKSEFIYFFVNLLFPSIM